MAKGTVDLADRIKRQSVVAEPDKKAKALILKSIATLTDGKTQQLGMVKLNRAAIQDLKNTKEYKLFRDKSNKKYKIVQTLGLDSRSKKERKCKNTGYCPTNNALATALGLHQFVTTAQAEIRRKKISAKPRAKRKVKVAK